MIHLVLDSNIFRQKPRLDSPEFKSIAYLAQKNNIRLHVPYFVEGEFVSFLENKQEERINRAIKLLEAASKYKNTGPGCRFSDYSSRKPAFFIGLNRSTC